MSCSSRVYSRFHRHVFKFLTYSTTHSKVMNKFRNIPAARNAWELPSVSSEGHIKASCSYSKYHTRFHEDCTRKSETSKVFIIGVRRSY